MKRRSLFGAALAPALQMSPLAQALAQFRVEVSGVGATQLPIAIARFREESRAPQPVSAIVQADLERSGLFKALNTDGVLLDEGARPPLAEWRGRGADALLAGSVVRLADGRYDIRFRLWDIVKGSLDESRSVLLSDGFVMQAADLRLAAHRIADAVYEKLTGEKGVFSTRIAYVSQFGRRHTLWVADADGQNAQAALGNSNQPIISPAWAPDGRTLAYVSFERGKAVVFTQDLWTGKRSAVAAYKGSNSAPAFSPDGRLLTVTLTREGGSQLYVMNADGGGLRRLSYSDAIDTESAWAPGGRQIYFVSDRSGGPQIYRIDLAGGAAQRITFSGGYNISPSPSPDGRWLAYITRSGGGFRLQLMDLGTGEVRGLTDTSDDERPSFAPNSRLIMYATRVKGRIALMTTSLDGRIKTRLETPQSDVRQPAWGGAVPGA